MDEFHDRNVLVSPTKQSKFDKHHGLGRKKTYFTVFALLLVILSTVIVTYSLHTAESRQKVTKVIWTFNDHDHNHHNDSAHHHDKIVVEPSQKTDEHGKHKFHTKKPHIKHNVNSTNPPAEQCSIEDDNRFDCHPDPGASQSSCLSRGCCWAPPKKPGKKSEYSIGVPYCFYPTNYPSSYEVINSTFTPPNKVETYLLRRGKSFYPNDVKLLKWDLIFSGTSLFRSKIYDPVHPRYEVPRPILDPTYQSTPQTAFNIQISEKPFSIKIKHKATNRYAFIDYFSAGNFIYADQFIQVPIKFMQGEQFNGESLSFYGLGERRDSFLRNIDWQQYTLFATDQAPMSNTNLYGSHPFLLTVDDSGNSAGLLFYNSNAMDIILQPAPAVTYRTTGGIIDFVYIYGTSPADVIQEYTKLIGRPVMPPYWALGFHLSRWGYNSVNETRRVLENNRNAGIPLDVQWNDIDYMDHQRDFTYDKTNFADLPGFVDDVHKAGMRYMVIVDPGLDTPKDPAAYPPYKEGLEQGIFINGSDGKPFYGKVWSDNGAVWPDFTNPKTTTFWTQQLANFYKEIPFDGLWIDMNEPSNFYNGAITGCPQNSTYENPPYLPAVHGGILSYKTICMTAQQYLGIHYNLHNYYSLSEAIATNEALKTIRPGKRPFIISRATFVGHGHYASHWSGDVYSTWDDMRKSIPAILDFSLFGIPMMGADICGFNGNTTEKLCQRWMELGSFYPFSRNHNTLGAIAQDPVSLGKNVTTSSRNSLKIRYQLLPYLYTLFYRAHVFGDTVARPLVFEYPNDMTTHAIDTQFLWGPALMILPVLDEDVDNLNSYFPADRWYLIHDPKPIDSRGQNYTIYTPPGSINIAVRGGYILPLKQEALTTTESRKGWFGLLVSLKPDGSADGELYWDDGETLDAYETDKYNLISFKAEQNTIQSTIEKLGAPEELTYLQSLAVYGVDTAPGNLTINGQSVLFDYIESQKRLIAENFVADLAKPCSIKWF